MKGGPREKPLGLDMPFDEAFKRFIGVDPAELAESTQRKRRPKPPPEVVDEEGPTDLA
jgi:hypothetical protein